MIIKPSTGLFALLLVLSVSVQAADANIADRLLRSTLFKKVKVDKGKEDKLYSHNLLVVRSDIMKVGGTSNSMTFADKMHRLYKRNKLQSKQNDKYYVRKNKRQIDFNLRQFTSELKERVRIVASGEIGREDHSFEYIIKDRDGGEFQTAWHDEDYVSLKEIKLLSGFDELTYKAQSLGLVIRLREEWIEEFDDEQRYRYIIRVGW